MSRQTLHEHVERLEQRLRLLEQDQVDAASEYGRRANLTQAESDVLRERQVQRVRWGDLHDDRHVRGQLARIAAQLTCRAGPYAVAWDEWGVGDGKPPRRQLVIAAALILSELERLDRALARETRAGV